MEDAPLDLLLVDDEPLARARARRLIAGLPGIGRVDEAGSVAAARARIAAAPPDVVLLDIQMPGEDGFALLRGLADRPAVIFVTAFDHYAVQAFEENAVDYLLKPFRRERLAEALERVRRERRAPAEVARRLAALLGAVGSPPTGPAPLERLTVRVGARQIILRTGDVRWFAAEDKLVYAATATDRHYVNFTLDQLEARLDPRKFARIHRGTIVNLDWAAALRPGFAGTWRLELRDEGRTELAVSRARARALRERLGA